MLGNVSGQLILAAAGTFLWYFCRLPRHVSGRDIESSAGAEPPPRLAVGLPYLILAIAAGKCAGSLYYFLHGIGRQ